MLFDMIKLFFAPEQGGGGGAVGALIDESMSGVAAAAEAGDEGDADPAAAGAQPAAGDEPDPQQTQQTQQNQPAPARGQRGPDGKFLKKSQGAAAPVAGTDPNTANAAAAAAAAWESQPLDPALQQKYGVKTLGEFTRKYEGSSQEAHRLVDEHRAASAQLGAYREAWAKAMPLLQQLQAQQAQKPAAVAAPPAEEWFGSKQYFQLMQTDPTAFKKKMAQELYAVQQEQINQQVDQRAQTMVQPFVQNQQQAQAQREQEQFLGHMENLGKQLYTRDPQFAPGGALHGAIIKWWEDNRQYEIPRVYQQQGYDPLERGRREILATLNEAQLKAAQEREKIQRGKAATPGPGTAATVRPKKGNLAQHLAAIAQDQRQNGNDINDSIVADLEAVLGEQLRFLNDA